MDEINGMTRCIEVSFQGMKFAMEASQSAITLLSRMLKVLYNSMKVLERNVNPLSEKNRERRDKRQARELAKETGKTSMELLKMKGQFMFGKMDQATFSEFKKQAKKYGIQYAMAPTLEDGITRVAIRDLDIAAFELFLKNYEKTHCITQNESTLFRKNNGMDSAIEYMQESKLASCGEKDFQKAMETVYGKGWDQELPSLKSMDTEKKREVFDAVTENEIKKAREEGKHLVVTFDSSQIFREDELTVSFSHGSFESGDMVNMKVDKEDIRYSNIDGRDMFVALVPEHKYVDVTHFGDTVTSGTVEVKDYLRDPASSLADAVNSQELAAITISKDIVKNQSETTLTTRIPGTFGKNVRYLELSLDNVIETHNGKSYLTYIDMNKNYTLHSEDGTVSKITGRDLKAHYDNVPADTLKQRHKMFPVFKKNEKTESAEKFNKVREHAGKKK